MSEKNIRQTGIRVTHHAGEFRLIADKHVKRFALAEVSVRIPFAFTVSLVVASADDHAVRRCKTGEIVIPPDMLRHAVTDLKDRARGNVGRVFAIRDLCGTVGRDKSLFFEFHLFAPFF